MKIYVYGILLLIQAASASLVTSPRPVEYAATKLQEKYGKVVTYEEPILTWRAELQAKPGRDPEAKWQLFPTPQSFTMPETGTDLRSDLDNTLAAYHQATSGTRFQVLSSKLGYHIVPVQMHDENGQSVPTTSLLDQVITVPTGARTPKQHLLAIGNALNSAGTIHVDISAVPGKPSGFDEAFRAQPEKFQWGVQSTTARDALIDLLNQSASTFSWSLMCQASAQPSDRFCALNVSLVEVAGTDAQGKPTTRVLMFDRGR